ncbi:RNA polymerase sigma factor [Asinibacterium sp. OR53]|uniref:RNA polymerase sigma factor n=1 Tax=Asinibacterium sp. OR53 TaxID=925409 RepID=UPI0004BC36B5|nr:RNA polymerase sigma-70 factor [Asinibacterium sp. OR53]
MCNEKYLLEQLIAGDEAAFKQLYFLYSERLYGNLLKLLKSESIAQEILQDVFMKIWDRRQHIDTEKSFRSYLFRIAENMVCNFYKKASREKALLQQLVSKSSEEYAHVEETLFSKEQKSFLHNAIESLPPQRKQVFELCKVEGKSYDEVSGLLGISISTISDHIVKANRFLREYCIKNKEFIIPALLVTLWSC